MTLRTCLSGTKSVAFTPLIRRFSPRTRPCVINTGRWTLWAPKHGRRKTTLSHATDQSSRATPIQHMQRTRSGFRPFTRQVPQDYYGCVSDVNPSSPHPLATIETCRFQGPENSGQTGTFIQFSMPGEAVAGWSLRMISQAIGPPAGLALEPATSHVVDGRDLETCGSVRKESRHHSAPSTTRHQARSLILLLLNACSFLQ